MNKRESGEQPDEADIRAQLERISSGDAFNKSPRLTSFLRFVVNEQLAGHGDRIKAYTIAADALGRDSNFDPQTNSIVRVEAGRVRRALKHHYTNGGANDPIVIDLPRGRYVPTFRANATGRRVLGRVHGRLHRAFETARHNFRLVLMIVVIAAGVSLSFELLGMLFTRSIWPAVESAGHSSPPAGSTLKSTGSVKH